MRQGKPEDRTLRTRVGNKVDDRLALGMARQFMTELIERSHNEARYGDPHLKVKSIAERKKSLLTIRDAFGGFRIGMVARKKFLQARIAWQSPMSSEPGKPLDSLAVFLEEIDLRKPGTRGPQHEKTWPFASRQVQAIIQVHAIARMIQRSGMTCPDHLLGTMQKVAAWSSLATSSGEKGSWMMSIPEGLVCAKNIDIKDPEGFISARGVAVVKTFIDHGRFRSEAEGTWDRLVSAGAMEATPDFPNWGDPSVHQMEVWSIMREEGRKWDVRVERAKAYRKKSADIGQDSPESEVENPCPS